MTVSNKDSSGSNTDSWQHGDYLNLWLIQSGPQLSKMTQDPRGVSHVHNVWYGRWSNPSSTFVKVWFSRPLRCQPQLHVSHPARSFSVKPAHTHRRLCMMPLFHCLGLWCLELWGKISIHVEDGVSCCRANWIWQSLESVYELRRMSLGWIWRSHFAVSHLI